jgi:hypothetical protein
VIVLEPNSTVAPITAASFSSVTKPDTDELVFVERSGRVTIVPPSSRLKSFWQEKNNTAINMKTVFLYNDLFVRADSILISFKLGRKM